MHDLDDLFYFSRVVEHGGFSAAARALKQPKSKLSRRVAALEIRLGVRLVNRDTRGISLTPIGEAFHAHCRTMLDAARSAFETVEQSQAQPRGTVRLSCPPGLLYLRLAPLISAFLARYPEVNLEIEAVARPVDPVREGFDVALRVRTTPLADSDLNMRAIAASPHRLIGAPELVAHLPGRATAPERVDWPALSESRPDGRYCWYLENTAGLRCEIAYRPRLVTDDMSTLRRAALDGLGVAQLPMLFVGDDLAAGRLVNVLAGWAPPDKLLHAVFASRRGQLPAVRALLDFLAESIGPSDFARRPPAGEVSGRSTE
ncbi:LysR substrate-binding domain-containing protein [Salinisphaera sp. LB1]|uniref:LysR substrate-binding domain-containing protein n=1 Tax=Salinisphaera sp. LB1 TaxID=2183911 RepID=UPI000D708ABC|nr:LysR substrate-binding domain-containing protein [Salinisphaera sp. LB1]AWN15332.1 Transcriptional regulator, LysR family [Salinisphaera sp. LB1]